MGLGCPDMVLQSPGTTGSTQPFITSARGCDVRGLITFYTPFSAGLSTIMHYSCIQ